MIRSLLGNQKGWWTFRAEQVHGDYGASLVLDPGEMAFQERHIKSGGDTLVLGATRSLCSIALKKHATVTSVDFADAAIEVGRQDEVEYICMEWDEYLEQGGTGKFDNIVTDGGMLCLDFPGSWERIAKNIHDHLRPGGVFAAKFYVSKPEPLVDYKNPNLGRFIALPASADNNWVVEPVGDDYKPFGVRYTLPPKDVVLQIFKESGQLELIEEFIPDYEAGDRFPSIAWKCD